MHRCLLFALLCIALVRGQAPTDPVYDHQTATYSATNTPATVSGAVTFMPFFSPDYSISVHVDLINGAQSTIDIGNPSWDSWGECTPFQGCQGCYVSDMRNESFPVFGAVLNALHRGVTVRILTNDYDMSDCDHKISPLPFLSLNGAQVIYYTSTTFMHAKFLAVDVATSNAKIAVSSVNFSQTSFLKNREAGAVISGQDAAPLLSFMMGVFNADFGQGMPLQINQTYSSYDMEIIKKKDSVKLHVPGPPTNPAFYVTPQPQPFAVNADVTISVSPDYAREQLMEDVNAASQSIMLHMYQVTDPGLCTALQQAHHNGINVTLLISSRIYDATDCAAANTCYGQMLSAGMSIQKTPYFYEYSHQKVWMMDTSRVGFSTGNWSPTDYPIETTHPMQYPPYGQSGWINANRDYNVHVRNDASQRILNVFKTVMTQDFMRGDAYSTNYPVTCGYTA